MRQINFRVVGAICAIAVFVGVLILINSFDSLFAGQEERNYNRFVQNVDGLTNTFRQPVEDCVEKEVHENDDCMKTINDEFANQFGSLVKLFGYESYIQELYHYWQADLQYWYDAKKTLLEYSERPEIIESEINRLTETREKAIQARLQPELALKVESNE